MSSLNTNIAAMTALQTLNQTNKEMLVTQNRISTGLRVKDASDNAAYWSIATTMRADNMAISTVGDALGLGAATAEVTATALNNSIETVKKMLAKLVAARAPGLDRVKIQSEISELQAELRSNADAAVFSGENWLVGDTTDAADAAEASAKRKSIVSSFSRDSTGAIAIGTIEVNVSGINLDDPEVAVGTMLFDNIEDSAAKTGILDSLRETTGDDVVEYSIAGVENALDISALTDSEQDLITLEDMIDGVDAALQTMTDAATVLGAAKSRISLQKDFVAKLMQSIDTGIGQLVDAEMNEESTRLQALQVRQQLGVQALGIANQSAQQILRLFQGG